jgi:phosphoglycolate phosphatase
MNDRRPAVILDLDGTLVDSRTDLAASVNAARVGLGLGPVPSATVVAAVGDGATTLLTRTIPEADAAALARALATFQDHYLSTCTATTAPYPGIPEALFALVQAGWRLGVCTNKPLVHARSILDACGLSRFLGHVLGGDRLRKPDPAAVLAVLTRLGADPGRSWMVGDHHTDLVAGEAAGCRTCFCAWGFGRRDGRAATTTAATPRDLVRELGTP